MNGFIHFYIKYLPILIVNTSLIRYLRNLVNKYLLCRYTQTSPLPDLFSTQDLEERSGGWLFLGCGF